MERCRYLGEAMDKTSIVTTEADERSHITDAGGLFGQVTTLSILPGSVATPLSDITCPRNETDFWNILHFEGLSFNRAPRKRSKNVLRRLRCSWTPDAKTMMSFKYTKQISRLSPAMIISISRWKVAGAPVRPNGITRNLKVPSRVIYIVFSALLGSIFTW